ncbi:apolipoprotein N-acyltransferase [Geothrix alkalitolerans]|uniref:apolipoprotein N-acyltransferase n=1 Tax=Geothrix alkalitolerans TaxID=2922724 RepID=UPI001FAF6B59|nr:apolipoprotein N-acyltransferase [Geothrix alkalitolerans]
MTRGWLLRPLETAVLACVFMLAFRFPGALGGWLEPVLALLFPVLLLEGLFKGRHAVWTWTALLGGLLLLYQWVPQTLASKGGLPFGLALLGMVLLSLWEATGLWLVALGSRWAFRRIGPLAAACVAAFLLMGWETWGFHVYPWTWGAAFGSLPWPARSAAFLGASGLSALAWGAGAWTAAHLAQGASPRRILAGPGFAVGLMLLLGGAWHLLPREGERTLDVAMIQPNFPAGVRWPGMEAEMWRRSDALLKARGWPRAGRATLLLWPESSVLGRDDRHPDLRLSAEAVSRGVAWLFGTEGGPYNLVRGEAAGRPPFIFAKTEPMPFGERTPGPEAFRRWLDGKMGFVSQEAGELKEGCAFAVPTPAGDLHVHPLICSEALLTQRTRQGFELGHADLLSNHTNDGWFDRSIATDLHAAQIRLRATELGVPLLRATLTGKSGVFREDGHFELWGEPLSEGAFAVVLTWRPVHTPARSAWLLPGLMAGLALGTVLLGWRALARKA